MLNLLKFNLKQLFISRGIFLNQVLVSIIVILGITIASSADEIKTFAKIIFIIIPQILFSLQSDYFFKKDYERGILEFQLITYENYQIFFAKILSMVFMSILVITTILSLCYISYDIELEFFANIFLGSVPLILSTNLIISISSAANIYFEDKGNIVSAAIFPFNLPSFVLYGLFAKSFEPQLLYISLGLVLILLPVSYFLVSSLFKEIYNS
jgi:ABC-type transport system involved in cytochrome c biogenesis permease component